MFQEISQMMYAYIIQAEMIFLDIYKINPWQAMDDIALIDLQFYIKRIEKDWKKKKDNLKKKDIMEALQQVNEVLTWVFNRK